MNQQPQTEVQRVAQAADEESIALMAKAEAFSITTADEFQASGDLLTEIKTRQKSVNETRTGITKPMDEAKKSVIALFKPVVERLGAAETTLKGAMLAFSQAEEEREAALEAERQRLAAIERRRLEKRTDTAREDGNDAKADVLEEALRTAVAPSSAPATKAKGVHTVTTWSAELVDKAALLRAAAADPSLAPYLNVDMTKLNSLARNLKGEMNIPGVKAVEKQGIAARAR